MSDITLLLTLVSLAASIVVILLQVRSTRSLTQRAAVLQTRLTNGGSGDGSTRLDDGSPRAVFEKWVEYLGRRFSIDQLITRNPHIALNMRRAGLPQTSAKLFYLAKFLMPAPVFLVGLLIAGIWDLEGVARLFVAGVISVVGFWLPDVWLTNRTQKRQQRIRLHWPDTLDLLQMCMRSGMSLEAALTKVSRESRLSCPDIADELLFTVAELSYLQQQRKALENLAERTGVASVREVVTALIQSQRYGATVADTLNVLAQENRAQRLIEAEKKAASLPPRLTVPMIAFFLPALFVVIITPAAIQLTSL
jgi:tight adherence protein C